MSAQCRTALSLQVIYTMKLRIIKYGPSLCDGDDDRVASADPRVGRLFLGGCTVWLASNGSLLTAGHCADVDPDLNGPMLPDGCLDLAGLVEFNFPASLSNGQPVRNYEK